MADTFSENSGDVTRRSFLLSSAAGALLLLVGNSTAITPSGPAPKHCILVDASKCIGCMRCIVGCENYHKVYEGSDAVGTAYTKVVELKTANVPELNYLPQLCLHCYNAPCVEACITHALTQLDYGAVVYDKNKCIGCLLCVNQCPFTAITFNPQDRKIYKCVMCQKAVEQGKEPYCVQVCPTGSRSFGLYEDKLAEGIKLVQEKQGVLLYPRDTSTLYVIPGDAFKKLLSTPGVTVIEKEYPADSRWIADLLKYSRVAWIPITLGAAFYAVKWSKNQSSGAT